MEAAWLLLEDDRAWLEAMPTEWWERWCWYFLRESRSGFQGDPDEAKATFSLPSTPAPSSPFET